MLRNIVAAVISASDLLSTRGSLKRDPSRPCLQYGLLLTEPLALTVLRSHTYPLGEVLSWPTLPLKNAGCLCREVTRIVSQSLAHIPSLSRVAFKQTALRAWQSFLVFGYCCVLFHCQEQCLGEQSPVIHCLSCWCCSHHKRSDFSLRSLIVRPL